MIEVFSFGGGQQSMAGLVLAAQGRLPYRTFLFCNVGEDAENPRTLVYVREVARPFAEAAGLTLLELQRRRADGAPDSLYQRLTRPGSRSIAIPVRMSASGAPGRRACTVDFKIHVVAKWLKQQGATPTQPATVALGISFDEIHRMRKESGIAHERLAYPLIDERLTRADCQQIIRAAGLPIPPKSSCWFCPYHRVSVWQEMRQEDPLLFAKAVELEALLNEGRAQRGMAPVWFTRALKPLAQATHGLSQPSLWSSEEDDELCESGYCLV